ncbi:MAG: hypothetical protein FJ294_05365 [Planctomycetes bacterium]|nr:hypothetical protein [Planctomycetota bacterium]
MKQHKKKQKKGGDKLAKKAAKVLAEGAAPKQVADHHDAELVLKLYDLRREGVMRASRDAIGKFFPKSYEELAALTKPEHPHNAAWRQVSSYFEMAYSFARHGVMHPDFLAENSGEGLYLFAKVEPHLARLRAETSPYAFANAEWLVEHSPAAALRMEVFRRRIAKVLSGG